MTAMRITQYTEMFVYNLEKFMDNTAVQQQGNTRRPGSLRLTKEETSRLRVMLMHRNSASHTQQFFTLLIITFPSNLT